MVPGRLLAPGFGFDYPHWPEAARELFGGGGPTAREGEGGTHTRFAGG